MDIKSGTSKIFLTDVAQYIDPTSVHIKLNGDVLEQNYQYDLVSLDKILQKYIDKEIQLIGENNEFIEGKLLSSFAGQIVVEKKEGGLVMIPNTAKYRFSVGSLTRRTNNQTNTRLDSQFKIYPGNKMLKFLIKPPG